MPSVSITDFTKTPGGRYKTDGKFSGEEFRENFLEPFFQGGGSGELTVVLDGTFYGFPPSFLDEAFGGLARKFGKEKVMRQLSLVSVEDQLLVDEIKKYIRAD